MSFLEVLAIVGILVLVGIILLIMRDKEKTNQKLEAAYPADTKQVIVTLVTGIIWLATRTQNTADDQGVLFLVTMLKGAGIDIPPELLAGLKKDTATVVNVTTPADKNMVAELLKQEIKNAPNLA